jgi:hypothetical protein
MYPSRGPEGCDVVYVKVMKGHNNGGVTFSDKFMDVRPEFARLLRSLSVTAVECSATPPFGGHSYEMAVVMCAVGRTGVYSGIVKGWDNKSITFTPALGYATKKEFLPTLVTPYDLPVLHRAPPRV